MTRKLVRGAIVPIALFALSCVTGVRPRHAAAQESPARGTAGALPASRDERWRADLHTLAEELPKRHKNAFAYVQAADFERAVGELDAAIPSLTDAQVEWRLQRLAAMVRDGHTRVGVPTRSGDRLPLSLFWPAASPTIVGASAEQQGLLGKRVLAVNGVPIADVRDTIARYLSYENPVGLRESASWFLLWPRSLRDVGLGRDSSRVTLDLEDAGGRRSSVELVAVPREGYHNASSGGPAPLYLQRPDEKYWFTFLPESRTLYLQYNRCMDAAGFRQLVDSVAGLLDGPQHPARLVVDLRRNPGGNSNIIMPLIAAIRARPAIDRAGALYVVVGRATFSSGVMGVVDLKRSTHATVVGEPNGERPNHYGEVRQFTLPNSGINVWYSTKYFREVSGDPDAVYPDVTTPMTPELMLAGRDPVMEWILARPLPPD